MARLVEIGIEPVSGWRQVFLGYRRTRDIVDHHLHVLVADDLCFGIVECLFVLGTLDEFDLFIGQAIEAVDDLINEGIGAGEIPDFVAARDLLSRITG